MTDKYGNKIKIGDEVAFVFYDVENEECCILKSPIIRVCEERNSVELDVRASNILYSGYDYEDGYDEEGRPIFLEVMEQHSCDTILVKRKEEV